jgi:hypothetical protein
MLRWYNEMLVPRYNDFVFLWHVDGRIGTLFEQPHECTGDARAWINYRAISRALHHGTITLDAEPALGIAGSAGSVAYCAILLENGVDILAKANGCVYGVTNGGYILGRADIFLRARCDCGNEDDASSHQDLCPFHEVKRIFRSQAYAFVAEQENSTALMETRTSVHRGYLGFGNWSCFIAPHRSDVGYDRCDLSIREPRLKRRH